MFSYGNTCCSSCCNVTYNVNYLQLFSLYYLCIVWFQKISIPSPWMVFTLTPPPTHPSGNSSLASYFLVKILAFEIPHPLRISNDHSWDGYGYFLEPHIRLNVLWNVVMASKCIKRETHFQLFTVTVGGSWVFVLKFPQAIMKMTNQQPGNKNVLTVIVMR